MAHIVNETGVNPTKRTIAAERAITMAMACTGHIKYECTNRWHGNRLSLLSWRFWGGLPSTIMIFNVLVRPAGSQ